jgi:trimeric autotransporter adhesin
MKSTKVLLLALLALCTLHSALSTAKAQSTAFTYQGLLSSSNPPVLANGTFDMNFLLFLDPAGSNSAGVPPYSNIFGVSNGVFTAQINFGPNVFTGTNYWMEIQVKQIAPMPDASFTTLTPLVELTATPNAIFATTASNLIGPLSVTQVIGTVPLSQLPTTVVVTGESNVTLASVTVSGTISGNGSGVLDLNGAQVFSVGNGNPLPSSPGSPPTFSAGNFSVGPSGNATTIGSDNTALGVYALSNNTSGSFNTAIGFNALYVNTQTSDNTAIGFNALYSNTNGSDNTAAGFDALYANTSGYENTANGSEALLDNTTGSDNTANGFQALFLNMTGSDNTAIGPGALYQNMSGSGNTAIGYYSLFANTSGSYNIALGYWAGLYVRGVSNIDIGSQGVSTDNNIIRIGSGQTTAYIAGVITGDGAGLSNLTLNAAQLNSVGNADGGSGNFFVGSSGNSTTSGSDNTGIGVTALQGNTSGSDNTAIGFDTLLAGSSGSKNTAIGWSALAGASGVNNIGLGWGAGGVLTGNESNNIEIGNLGVAGDNNIIRIGTPGIQSNAFIAGVINGDGGGLTNLNASQLTSVGNGNGIFIALSEYNFFVGPSGNSSTTGSDNTAIGYLALSNNMSGTDNTAIGWGALGVNTAGIENTAIGSSALAANTGAGANGNTAIGFDALGNITSGSGNIALGLNAGSDFVGNESDNIDIGNQGNAGENNIIRIGASQTATYLVGTVYANDVALTSDRHAKENFTAVNPRAVLEKVAALPITQWKYRAEPDGTEHLGPMAQDFHTSFGLNGEDDKHISVVDEGGVALAAIQGLNLKLEAETKEKDAEIEKLREKAAKVDSLQEQNDSLAARLNELEARVKALAEKK